MITKTPAFQTSDGNTFATLEIAQRAELLRLLTTEDTEHNGVGEEMANRVLHVLFMRLDDVKEILRATGRRQRKAKGNGATRKRTRTLLDKAVDRTAERKTTTPQSETK